jgi:hypothetical protein
MPPIERWVVGFEGVGATLKITMLGAVETGLVIEGISLGEEGR